MKIGTQMSNVESTAGATSGTVMNRRALLRASGVAAGVAGIGGIAAASAPSAGAAAGDPVLMGATNDAGTASTVLTTNVAGPTLTLANTGPGVPLRLPGQASVDLNGVKEGDLWYAGYGHLQLAFRDSAAATVLTNQNYKVAQLIPVKPTRAVDTRYGARIIANPTGNLDSAGRLIGGHTIDLDFGEYMVFQGLAVLANLTVTQPTAGGYLTMWQQGPRPGTSTLNYSAGQVLSNFCVSGLYQDKVRLYASSTTHVVLDVVAFVVYSSSDINDDLLQYPPEFSSQAGRKPPAWWTSQNG